jgi:hypothetical protein
LGIALLHDGDVLSGAAMLGLGAACVGWGINKLRQAGTLRRLNDSSHP